MKRITNFKPTGSAILSIDSGNTIGDRFVFALMRAFFKPLVHSPDILARFPEAVVIRAKQNQLPLDVLDLYHFVFCVLPLLFGIYK